MQAPTGGEIGGPARFGKDKSNSKSTRKNTKVSHYQTTHHKNYPNDEVKPTHTVISKVLGHLTALNGPDGKTY